MCRSVVTTGRGAAVGVQPNVDGMDVKRPRPGIKVEAA